MTARAPRHRMTPAPSVRHRFNETRLGAMPLGLSVILASGLALSFLWGSERRFGGTAWDSPFRLMDQQCWGWLFVAYGAALLLACTLGLTVVRWALAFGALPYGFLAIAFAWSALASPVAATTGVVAYACIAIAHPVLGELYRK